MQFATSIAQRDEKQSTELAWTFRSLKKSECQKANELIFKILEDAQQQLLEEQERRKQEIWTFSRDGVLMRLETINKFGFERCRKRRGKPCTPKRNLDEQRRREKQRWLNLMESCRVRAIRFSGGWDRPVLKVASLEG